MAARYFLNIGSDWGSTANWSDTSGGAGGFSVPTGSDDVFFDANSGNCSLNGTRTCLSINFTGYTNTLTLGANDLNILSGGYVLISTLSLSATTGRFVTFSTCTLTNNGYVFTIGLSMNGGATVTLADNITMGSGTTLTLSAAAGSPLVINNNSIIVNGNLTGNTSTGQVQGTTVIRMQGTGNMTSTSTGSINNSIEINTTGTVTVVGTFITGGGTLTFTTPNNFIAAQNSTFNVWTATSMVASSDVRFWNLIVWVINASGGGNIIIENDLSIGLQNNSSGISGCDVYLFGNLIYNGFLAGATTTGTNLYIVGNKDCVWTTSGNFSSPTNPHQGNIIINKSGKVIMPSLQYVFGTGSITYIRGDVVMTNRNARFVFTQNYTLNGTISKMRLRNVRTTNGISHTFNGEFFSGSADNILTVAVSEGYPYAVDVNGTYFITLNGSGEYFSHFCKIRGAAFISNRLKMTYNVTDNGLNSGVIHKANQLPNSFPKDQPIANKQQMFGKLMSDPVINR